MSATRDRLNASSLLSLLGRREPPQERPRPVVVAAAAGAGAGGASAPELPLTVQAPAGLTVGALLYLDPDTGTWTTLDPDVGRRVLPGVVLTAGDAEADPAVPATVLLWGILARDGTPGACLYATASGLGEAYPGDPADETDTAPWVHPIGWQIDATHALIRPQHPFRPRSVTLCDGEGSPTLAVIVSEIAPEPA